MRGLHQTWRAAKTWEFKFKKKSCREKFQGYIDRSKIDRFKQPLHQIPTYIDRSMHPAFFPERERKSCQPVAARPVGLILSDVSNPFFAEIIPAIEDCLGAAGFTTLLGNASEDCTREARLLKTMRECSPTGVLICPSSGPEPVRTHRCAFTGPPPTVAFARPVDGLDYVGVNNGYGAELAVDYLYQIGHRKIAFVGGQPQDMSRQERVEGYKRALTRRSLPFEIDWIALSCPNRCGGYRSTVDLLELKNPPTAAVCFNDLVAFGLIQALQQAGRKPGSEFGVIGFNDVPVVVDDRPLFTTVDTAPRQVGEIAAELLLRRIAKPDSLLQRVILQPRLIVRQSCGTLA
jgi:LacI family transcriptional regulator